MRRWSRRTVSMLWLKTSGRAPSTVASASSSTPRKSGVSTSTDESGSLRLSARIVAAKCPAPRSARSSRSTDVTTTCASPIVAAACASRSGSSGSGGVLGPARVDVAVAARAGARVAEDLERRGAAAPALADVRAARLLADGDEARAVEQLADVVVAAVGARRAHLHPLGAARALGDGKRRLHRRQCTGVAPGHRAPPGRLSGARSPRRRAARGPSRPRGRILDAPLVDDVPDDEGQRGRAARGTAARWDVARRLPPGSRRFEPRDEHAAPPLERGDEAGGRRAAARSGGDQSATSGRDGGTR